VPPLAPGEEALSGAPIDTYVITNGHGLRVSVLSLGAIIQSVIVPDRDGELQDVVLGHDSPEEYLVNPAYLGAVVGRYANRIAGARFTLDGTEHRLTANDGANSLHGGRRGFDRALWSASRADGAEGEAVALALRSPDGDEGYPGTLDARVTYTLTGDDRLIVDYEASTDRATPVNLSQHTYWNLAGARRSDILGHELQIEAERFIPIDETLIPTGELRPVDGTPFDFRVPTAIGARIGAEDEQLRRGRGYDHNFVLSRSGSGLARAARLTEPLSGRSMEVWTTEPGLQFYSGNFLDGTIRGKEGRAYLARSGCCLETQHFPDSPNHPNFPSTILRPGMTWRSRTVFAFGRMR
jgi:aldose 1-epimerase